MKKPRHHNGAETLTIVNTTTSPAQVNRIDARSIADSMCQNLHWVDAVTAYGDCPGKASHTSKNAPRDFRVKTDNIPGGHCVHTTCLPHVEAWNHDFRSAIAKGQCVAGYRPARRTPEQIAQQKERERYQALKLRAKATAQEIYTKYETTPAELVQRSPFPIGADPQNDWRFLLPLFAPDDVIWIGDTKDSCNDDADDRRKAECRKHFRTVAEWLTMRAAPGQFTCPSVFKCGVHSRSNANVLLRRYLVVESDTLTKPQIVAVFVWCQQFMRLRAVVDTAGRSLHGWFDAPCSATERELKSILPEMGCDPALFKMAQPCRLPGAPRDDRIQRLLYLDLEGTR